MRTINSSTTDVFAHELLVRIKEDFYKVSPVLQKASESMRVGKYSHYPIFLLSHLENIPEAMGVLLVGKEDKGTAFHYYASCVEYLKVLLKKEEDFIKTYKNPDEYCCLFSLLDKDFTKMFYLPYHKNNLTQATSLK